MKVRFHLKSGGFVEFEMDKDAAVNAASYLKLWTQDTKKEANRGHQMKHVVPKGYADFTVDFDAIAIVSVHD